MLYNFRISLKENDLTKKLDKLFNNQRKFIQYEIPLMPLTYLILVLVKILPVYLFI